MKAGLANSKRFLWYKWLSFYSVTFFRRMVLTKSIKMTSIGIIINSYQQQKLISNSNKQDYVRRDRSCTFKVPIATLRIMILTLFIIVTSISIMIQSYSTKSTEEREVNEERNHDISTNKMWRR